MTNILDSSLITPTKTIKKYNTKVIQCGDYIQLFFYSYDKLKNIDNEFSNNIKTLKRNLVVPQNSLKVNSNSNSLKTIELKNINRSKINCQLLAKANLPYWKTFITLTYADNITDVSLSRKHFRYFIDTIRRVKKDFMYLCITEFQKRGAIHFHLLTNVDLNDSSLIYFQVQEKKSFSSSSSSNILETNNSQTKLFPHIKYWSHGFNSVEQINGDTKKIIGYISKYMTKDIDNRLYSKRRFMYSKNLVKPFVTYLNIENKKDYLHYIRNITKDFQITYTGEYTDKLTRSSIVFYELLK